MLFIEPLFLFVVLPLAAVAMYGAGYYFGQTAAVAVIVAASAVFYAPYGVLPGLLLCISLGINLTIGFLLCGIGVQSEVRRKILLGLGLAYNFGSLAFFKYLDPLAMAVLPSAAPLLGIAIPAGISFYTFHQAVFLLDAFKRSPEVEEVLKDSRGGLERLRACLRYAAFVAFFPQLVIGPITYMSEFAPQVMRRGFGRVRITDIQVGAMLIVIGLFKKICIADLLAETVNPIFTAALSGVPISPRHAFFAIAGYFFQLYFDFSGYADIALGIARLFGIRLPINFDSPLRATGIVDFYRRWHITLTRVIALFLFTPLSLWGGRVAINRGYSGWRRRALMSWLPLLANFQVIALWHAAKPTFVVFGLIHGVWYVFENEIRNSKLFKSYRQATSNRFRMIAGMAITLVPLMLTFALFRSPSLTAFANLLNGLVAFEVKDVAAAPLEAKDWQLLGLTAAVVYLLPNAYEFLRKYRPGIVTYVNPSTTPPFLNPAWRPNLLWAVVSTVMIAGIFTRFNRPAPFLYGGF